MKRLLDNKPNIELALEGEVKASIELIA